MSMIEDATGALLSGAAKGAAFGSVVPGIGTAIGAAAGGLLGVALNVAPGVSQWLAGSTSVAQQAVAAVQSITGTADPAAAQAALAADAGMTADLHVQLVQLANEARAEENRAREADQAASIADTTNARSETLKLVQAGSPMAWGAAIVSGILLTAWFSSLIANYFGAPSLSSDDSATLRNLALLVAGYWIGTNRSSDHKTDLLSQSVPASFLPNPGAVVPAADVKGN